MGEIMKNTILSAGTIVKYHRQNADVGRHGFSIGHTHVVMRKDDGTLFVQNDHGVQLALVDALGSLTEWSDYFAIITYGTLPKGIQWSQSWTC
jgi:hypothetical protein